MRRELAIFLVLGLALVIALATGTLPAPMVGADRPVRILAGAPATLDPARQGDAGSAAITAQIFETLTTFDTGLVLRPALADSWQVEPGGKRVTFHLRPNLTFSDGSPLRASDVVRSWLRVIDPRSPSPLASLLLVVDGAAAYMAGGSDAATVGLVADDGAGTVSVTMARPAADFVDVVASPTFAIVPASSTSAADFAPGGGFVASGGYRPTAVSDTVMTLTANPHYWAGPPAVGTIQLSLGTGGQSAVQLFGDGSLDVAQIFGADASWVAYDRTLGPQLREVKSLVTTYYGFDAGKAPFDDVRVRQAFAMAVDWRRIGLLGSRDADAEPDVPTSMVPPGIPGRSTQDFLPKHDPAAARALLAAAGFPGGAGFPAITMITEGGSYDGAILAEVKRELGITLGYETMGFEDYIARLDTDPPAIWSSSWVADYPGRNDFLGVLLGGDSTNDYGRWQSDEFDQALADAAAAADPAQAAAAFDRAETVLGRDAPVVPIGYGGDWILTRDGLQGAGENGLGIIRMAGLKWAK